MSNPAHVTVCQSRLYSPVRDLGFGLLSNQREKGVTVCGGGVGWGGTSLPMMAGSLGRRIVLWRLGKVNMRWGGGGGACALCTVQTLLPPGQAEFTLMTEGHGGASWSKFEDNSASNRLVY
jgi:hypothetical protein